MTTTLHIDKETKSKVDLKRAGAYVYAEDPSSDIWCAAYAIDDGPIHLWTPEGDDGDLPYALKHCDLASAHNAAFERAILRGIGTPRYGLPPIEVERWRCTMVKALAMSLPGSLKNACAAVGIDLGGKAEEGHRLMLQMSQPRRPRKGELPGQTYWFDDADRRQRLYDICKKDVADERELDKRLLPLRPAEQSLWQFDQRINDRGVFVDTPLCDAALKIVNTAAAWLDKEMSEVTKGFVGACSNVNQIGEWLRTYGGLPDTDSIAKGEIDDLLLRRDLSPACRRVLELRREAAKASVAKIDAILEGKSADGRARGLLQFHAASTGRWAGRRFQPQNLPRGTTKNVDAAVEAVATGDAEYVQLAYGEPLNVVSGCLRSLIRAAPGRRLLVADFSNIEGRVQAWFGGEEWKLDAFRAFDAGKGWDIYKLAYARAFGIRPEDVTDHMRQVGKVMELALGYAGGVGAFQKMAVAYKVEVTDQRADDLKVAWRKAHPGIVNYWRDLQNAAIQSVQEPGKVVEVGRIRFRTAGSFCFMRLPSGRAITYPYPRVEWNEVPWKKKNPEWVPCDSLDSANFLYGDDCVRFDEKNKRALIHKNDTRPTFVYKGVDAYTRKWCDQHAHGGVLFNNVVQGTARDIEAEAMVRIEAAGYPNVLSVHDEVVAEPKLDAGSVAEFQRLMTKLPAWADGLPVTASAWEGVRYKKA